MTSQRVLKTFLVLVIVGILVPPRAHGYVDAGSGSYVLQLALGGIFGLTLSFRRLWRGVRERISRRAQPEPLERAWAPPPHP